MEERKPLSHIAAGLMIAGAVVLLSVVFMLAAGRDAGPGGGWLSYLIIIIGLVLFIQRYGRDIQYKATFSDYFNYGFKATTVIVLLVVVYFTALAFLMPQLKQSAIDAARTEMEGRKNFTDQDINRVMEMTNKYFWTILIGTAVFLNAVVGAIGSLIGAAVTKKLPKNPFEQTSA